jgi:hypothetical protein
MSNETHTYWVSIGRNVGADPLSDAGWTDFQESVVSTILRHGRLVSQVEGRSVSSDWSPEDTALFLTVVPADHVPNVRAILSATASYYGQEAIGFVGGPSTDTLIRP